jgi:hypothetical protein
LISDKLSLPVLALYRYDTDAHGSLCASGEIERTWRKSSARVPCRVLDTLDRRPDP